MDADGCRDIEGFLSLGRAGSRQTADIEFHAVLAPDRSWRLDFQRAPDQPTATLAVEPDEDSWEALAALLQLLLGPGAA